MATRFSGIENARGGEWHGCLPPLLIMGYGENALAVKSTANEQERGAGRGVRDCNKARRSSEILAGRHKNIYERGVLSAKG